jgi:hypothetical protein
MVTFMAMGTANEALAAALALAAAASASSVAHLSPEGQISELAGSGG